MGSRDPCPVPAGTPSQDNARDLAEPGFRLDEPDLLLWVHCAEVDSYADICRRCGMGATPDQLDAFVAEQRRSAVMVGLNPQCVPGSVGELDAYYRRARHQAHARDEAKKSLLMYVLNPPVPPALAPLRPGGGPSREHPGVRDAAAVGPQTGTGPPQTQLPTWSPPRPSKRFTEPPGWPRPGSAIPAPCGRPSRQCVNTSDATCAAAIVLAGEHFQCPIRDSR